MSTTTHGDTHYRDQTADYQHVRRPDARIGAMIHAALGDARSVLNVGAGQGSYEPEDRHVIALEPAHAMRARRPRHLAPAIIGDSSAIPLDDGAVDACMAVATVHQWAQLERGLAELRRVTAGPVVLVVFDPVLQRRLWLNDYCPALFDVAERRDPALERLARGLGGAVTWQPVPIPADCTDGFVEAFFARPEAFLQPQVIAAQSTWGFVSPDQVAQCQQQLARDLADGTWDARHGHWRTMATYEGSLTLMVSHP